MYHEEVPRNDLFTFGLFIRENFEVSWKTRDLYIWKNYHKEVSPNDLLAFSLFIRENLEVSWKIWDLYIGEVSREGSFEWSARVWFIHCPRVFTVPPFFHRFQVLRRTYAPLTKKISRDRWEFYERAPLNDILAFGLFTTQENSCSSSVQSSMENVRLECERSIARRFL